LEERTLFICSVLEKANMQSNLLGLFFDLKMEAVYSSDYKASNPRKQ
jgi:hypothetical protein